MLPIMHEACYSKWWGWPACSSSSLQSLGSSSFLLFLKTAVTFAFFQSSAASPKVHLVYICTILELDFRTGGQTPRRERRVCRARLCAQGLTVLGVRESNHADSIRHSLGRSPSAEVRMNSNLLNSHPCALPRAAATVLSQPNCTGQRKKKKKKEGFLSEGCQKKFTSLVLSHLFPGGWSYTASNR